MVDARDDPFAWKGSIDAHPTRHAFARMQQRFDLEGTPVSGFVARILPGLHGGSCAPRLADGQGARLFTPCPAIVPHMSPAAARLLARDALITAACACLWWLDIRGELAGAGGAIVSVLAGLSTGVLAFVAHEWGHAMGSKLSGATIYFTDSITSPFLFFFDTGASTKNQFVAMSMGGYAASALALVAALVWLPRDQLSGQVGLAIVGLGIVATLAAEVPTTIRVARGGPMPRGYVYRAAPPSPTKGPKNTAKKRPAAR